MQWDLSGTSNNLHTMNFQSLLIWKAFLGAAKHSQAQPSKLCLPIDEVNSSGLE